MTIDNDGSEPKILPFIPNAEEGGSTVQKAPTADDGFLEPVLSDDQLVEKAIEDLKSAFPKGVWSTIINIGKIVIQMVEDSKRMRSTSGEKEVAVTEKVSATKSDIFKKLEEKIAKLSDKEFLPKKTYLYNAVRLVEGQEKLDKINGYKKLSISHKIALLPVPSEKIRNIINQVVKNSLSVRKTKDLIKRECPSEQEETIYFYIQNPSQIDEIELVFNKFSGILSVNESKSQAIESCTTKLVKLKNEIDKLNAEKEKIKMLLDKINEFKNESEDSSKQGNTEDIQAP